MVKGCDYIHIHHTCHMKNIPVVNHMPKVLSGVFPYLLMFHSFSTLLIPLFWLHSLNVPSETETVK